MTFCNTRFAPLCAGALFGLLAPEGGAAWAQNTPPAQAGAQAAPVLRRPNLAGLGTFNTGNGAKLEVLTDSTAPGGVPEVLHFVVPNKTPNPWDVQYQVPLTTTVAAGQKLILHFWVRSQTETPFTALVEESAEPYDKAVRQVVTPTKNWQEITLPFVSPAYGAGKAHIGLQMGANAGEIDIAGLRLESADATPAAIVPPAPLGADLLGGVAAFSLTTPTPQAAQKSEAGGSVKVTIFEPMPDAAYKIQLTQKINAPVAEGQILSLRFKARSPTKSAATAVYETAGEPYDKALSRLLALTPEWKDFSFTIKTPAYAQGGAQVNFQLGAGKGQVEIADLHLVNFGINPAKMPGETARNYYGILTRSDAWRTSANARIEKFRKGNLVVDVVDASGKPVSGASVSVKQTKHAFRWGVALSPGPLFAQTPDGEKYRGYVLKLFNYAVLENQLKWNSTAPDAFDTADKMLDWCKSHNIPVRGHNLLWAGFKFLPADIVALKDDKTALQNAIHAHVTDYVTRTKGRVVVWDAVNEAVSNTDVAKAAGPDILADVFFWAHAANPDVPLAYNEDAIFRITNNDAVGSSDKKIDDVLHFLIDEKHAPVTVLGLQSHMGGTAPLVPGGSIAKNLEHWRTYGLPIEITEFDASIPDDKTQAEFYNEFMTAVFAEPTVTSFVQWGFWEGAHWLSKQGGAIVRQDFSPRPAEAMYEKLVFHDWWTNATGATAQTGNYQTRAFLGTHEITVSKNGKTVKATATVSKNENGVETVTVRL